MQIQILKINGTAKELYPLVGPLVMNPEVLKYNNRYPFKTKKNFEWYIALNETDGETIGFIPLYSQTHGIPLPTFTYFYSINMTAQ